MSGFWSACVETKRHIRQLALDQVVTQADDFRERNHCPADHRVTPRFSPWVFECLSDEDQLGLLGQRHPIREKRSADG